METLAQRWREEGYLLDRQEILIMLLSSRFHVDEDEKQFIREIRELEKLNAALKLVITAKAKEEILQSLKPQYA